VPLRRTSRLGGLRRADAGRAVSEIPGSDVRRRRLRGAGGRLRHDGALAKNGLVVKGDARCPVDGIALKNVNVRATVENPFVLDNVRNVDLSGLRLGDARKLGLSREAWNKLGK